MIVGPRFIWLHFPKCAGSTVANVLHSLAADRSDVHCDKVVATSDLSQVIWHQNVRERRKWDTTFVSDGKEIVANFRRLPDWVLSKIHFAARLVPQLVPTRQ